MFVIIQSSPKIAVPDRDVITWSHDAAWRHRQVQRCDTRPVSRVAKVTAMLVVLETSDTRLVVQSSTLVRVPDDSGRAGRRRSQRVPRAARHHLRLVHVVNFTKQRLYVVLLSLTNHQALFPVTTRRHHVVDHLYLRFHRHWSADIVIARLTFVVLMVSAILVVVVELRLKSCALRLAPPRSPVLEPNLRPPFVSDWNVITASLTLTLDMQLEIHAVSCSGRNWLWYISYDKCYCRLCAFMIL